MTKSRGRLVPAVLFALATGAGTAGVTTVLAAPSVEDTTPSPVAMNLTSPAGTQTAPPSTAAPSPTTAATSAKPSGTTTVKATTTTSAKPTTTTTAAESTEPTTEPALTVDAEVLAIVNDERAENGCAPVKLDARLAAAGQGHSEDMAEKDYFSHTSLDGRTFVDRAKAEGYRSPGAENIARGQRTPEQVMDAWMNSPGHRANILNCDLKTMGIGLETDGYYWTQVFGY
ncbi:CAP domain-containing protein [Actinokineospora sp. UTMC 2448]|uniref:CAP domain-containing protein n=1 Tax=Actinokineospora sp. UTMC 2448 TaxID=2268449 RepID=UPI0021646BFB|nr:CAP domain-containing protein [Actinokineospora sp. UTMC 2448]